MANTFNRHRTVSSEGVIMDLVKAIERIRERTTIHPKTQCWLYEGYKVKKGYGVIVLGTTKFKVHRVSAAIYLGYDITDEICQILHKDDVCSYKHCWNPDHLYIGTTQDNAIDRKAKKLLEIHCPNGHEYTEENTYIDKKESRRCKACNNERAKARYNGVS